MNDDIEPTVVPYMLVKGAARAIEFYCAVFDAEESGARFTDSAGKVGHAQIRIGHSCIMLADENEPAGYVFSPFMFLLRVDDADAVVRRAVDAGATLVRPLQDQPYGSRSGVVRDPFGHSWMINQEIETVSREELQRRVGDDYTIS